MDMEISTLSIENNSIETWIISLVGMDMAVEEYIHLILIEEIFEYL